MYTQCPDCHTVYAVDAATLAQAHGSVGCGQCGTTFNALTTLVETWPDDAPEVLPAYPTSPGPPVLMMPMPHPASPSSEPAAGAAGVANSEAADAPDAADRGIADVPAGADNAAANTTPARATESSAPLPSFVRRARAARRPRHRMYWALGCLVLALVLGAQLVWIERVPLTANPDTRPWLAQACAWFGCTLPPVRDLADLELLSRDVRPHPNVPNALLISATLRNNAPFTQPYPVVSITLSDLDENRIAMRRFRPSDYIADPKVRAAGLAPGATAALMFEVKDPGRDAVAFQFGFQ